MRKPYTWNLIRGGVLKLLGGLAFVLFAAGLLLGDWVDAQRK